MPKRPQVNDKASDQSAEAEKVPRCPKCKSTTFSGYVAEECRLRPGETCDICGAIGARCGIEAQNGLNDIYQGWRPMNTAPKSVRVGASIQSHYILGYCPEDGVRDPQSCLVVIWWEPNMNGGKGLWWCDGEFEAHPTHWHPLPCAPTEDVDAPHDAGQRP